MLDMMQRIVLDMIVAGAPAHDLVEILSSDNAKASALMPLIVALRQYAGETVRAPGEVLEVAADIRERIEEQDGRRRWHWMCRCFAEPDSCPAWT